MVPTLSRGVSILEGPLPEPLDAPQVKSLADRIWNAQGWRNMRAKNITRHNIRHRLLGTDIKGISQKLEDLSPAANVHGTRYVNRIVGSDDSVECASRSADDAAVDAAGRTEDYHSFTLTRLRKQRTAGILAPLRRSVDDATFYAVGWIRSGFSPAVKEKIFGDGKPKDTEELIRRLEAAYEEGFDEDPFLDEVPATETVAAEPDLSIIVERGKRTVSQMLRLYQDEDLGYSDEVGFEWLTSETRPEYNSSWDVQEVNYYHVETANWIYDLVDTPLGEKPFLLECIPNPIGRPWYAMVPGHITNEPDISERFLPLIADVYPIVHTINVLQTLLASGALNTGRPMYQEVQNGRSAMTMAELITQPVEQRPVIEFDPSESVLKKPRAGYHWDVVPVPDMGWVLQALDAANRKLTEFGFPVSLSPQTSTEGSAESAAQGMQQIEVSVHYITPALTNVALALQELMAIHADVLQEIGMPVTIPVARQGGDPKVREMVTIKPSDFKGVETAVKLEAIPASALLAIMSFDLELVQAKMMSKRDFFEKHYQNWKKALKNVTLDEAKAIGQSEMLKLLQQFIQNQGPAIFAQAAAEQNIPLDIPGLANQSGGPAPAEDFRMNRPPAPVAGQGVSPTPVDQNPAQSAGAATEIQV